MKHSKTHYFKVLGIAPTEDKVLIKKAYRKKAFHWHPDRNSSKEASKYFIELTEAYEALVFHSDRFAAKENTVSAETLFAERMKRAKARYYEAKMKEALAEQLYFNKLIAGVSGKAYVGLSLFTLLFGVVWLVDFYLLSPVSVQEIISEYKHQGRYFYFDIQGFNYVFKVEEVYGLVQNNTIVAKFTPLFGDLKYIDMKDVYTDVIRVKPIFSYAFFTPFIQMMYAVPFVVFLFKQPQPWFTLSYYFSIYFIFPLFFLLLLTKCFL